MEQTLEQKRQTLTNVHSDTAVPMFADLCNREQYIKRLESNGYVLYADAGTGLYFRHPQVENAALWVGWEFDGIFYIERMVVS